MIFFTQIFFFSFSLTNAYLPYRLHKAYVVLWAANHFLGSETPRHNTFDQFWKIKPLNTNPTKWSNTFKKFVGKLPTNCLSMFDHFVGLAFKGLDSISNIFQETHDLVLTGPLIISICLRTTNRHFRDQGNVLHPTAKLCKH